MRAACPEGRGGTVPLLGSEVVDLPAAVGAKSRG